MRQGGLALVACVVAACDTSLPEIDQIYSLPGDGQIVCGISIDNKNTVSVDSIGTGLDRASALEQVVHLYSHRPAGTVDESTIEEVIAAAADRNLPFVTYGELASAREGAPLYGLALSFDDHDLDGWYPLIPLFATYGARVTFFISEYHIFSDDGRAKLRALADAGHDIQYHGSIHDDAADYASQHGVDGYVADEIAPDLALMRADGYDPQVFAYPFGARTAATDDAVLRVVPFIRGSYFNCPR